MYDEFERAVTGKPKQGIPVFGWVLIVLAFLFMFGVVGVGFAAHTIANKVRHEFSGEFTAELADELADLKIELAGDLEGLDPDLLSRLEPHLGRIMGNPAFGMALMEDLGSSEYSEKALRDILEGSLSIRTEDGELTADLWRGEDGGSLVIESPDGGELTIDLVRADGGGSLVIRSEEKVMEFAAGSEAQGLPGWVPAARGMPDTPKPLFSMMSEDGALGAVSWETDESPEAILDFYRETLADDGYRIREEHSSSRHGKMDGGFWAENDDEDRVVFVAASEEDGVTKVLLGYGEEIH